MLLPNPSNPDTASPSTVFDDLSHRLPPLPFWLRMVQAGEHENLQYAFGGPGRTGDVALVDPTWELEGIAALLETEGRTPRTALFTHGHWDHIGGAPWSAGHGIEVVVHEAADQHPKVQEARDAGGAVRLVRDGDVLELDGVRVEVLATPGHQRDAVCYLVGAASGPQAIFTGDTLFIGSCGRTDFPGGDTALMFDSMRRLASLGGEVHVMPGHNYADAPTRPLSAQRKENAALSTTDRTQFAALPFLRG